MSHPPSTELQAKSSVPLEMSPADIARRRQSYIRILIALLGLVGVAILLAVYGVLSDTAHADQLETVALVLFVGPGFAFVYFAEKLQAYKMVTPDQEKELAGLCRDHPDIADYCKRLAELSRKPMLAEYEACKAHGDELAHKEKH